MQSVTNAEKSLLESYSPVHLRLYLGGVEVPALMGRFTLTEAVGDESLTVGNAIATTVEIGVDAGIISRFLATHNDELITTHNDEAIQARINWSGISGMNLSVTWDVDGETEHDLFHGVVERVNVAGGKATIYAQDAFFWTGSKTFNMASYQSNTAATTALTAIASGLGVTVDSDTTTLATGVTISGGFSSCPPETTLVEAAGYVAGILGGNAKITRDGKLAVKQYATTSFSSEPYSGGASAENRNYKVSGLSFHRTYTTRTTNADGSTSESESERYYNAGDGSNVIDNPLADQASANRAYTALSGIASRKGTFSYPMGIQVEAGDVITITSMDGNYPVAVASHTLEIDGGVKSTDRSAGQQFWNGKNGWLPSDDVPVTRSLRSAMRSVRSAVSESDNSNDEQDDDTGLMRSVGDGEQLRSGDDDIGGDSAPGDVYTPGRQGPLSKKVDRLEAEILKVKNLQAENATITNANIQTLQTETIEADRIDVDGLFAEDITATGTFQVNNEKISLIADNNGVRITPQSWQSTEFQASLGLHRTYTILTGSVTQVQGTSQIDVYSEGLLNLSGSLGVVIGGGTESPSIGIQMQSDTKPVITNTFSLGDSSTRWKYIYLNNNPNVSSDRRLKTDILDAVPDIVDNLIPVSYRLKGDPEGRIHYGFIAQDVESALIANNIETDNIGLVRSENGQNYSLAYDELIPILVAKIQDQQEQIDTLTERLDRLERMMINDGR